MCTRRITLATAVLKFASAVEKAKPPSPLSPDGFEAWEERYAAAVIKASKKGDARALKAVLRNLDKDWAKLSVAKRNRAVDRAIRHLSLTAAERVAVTNQIGESMSKLMAATKRAAKSEHGLKLPGVSLDDADLNVVKATRRSQAHYIRDAYGRRRVALSKQARAIVADGVEAGFDSATIAEGLSDAMSTAGVLRARAYWQTVSSIFAARGRSYALARSYSEAGIGNCRAIAVLDNRTTEQCWFMHEKVIPVAGALGQYEEVAESEDPEAVAEVQPFMQLGKNDDGDEVLYVKRGGQRHVIAVVEKAARGVTDGPRGSYRQAVSDKDLVDAGIGLPPYHGRCRTTTVPA